MDILVKVKLHPRYITERIERTEVTLELPTHGYIEDLIVEEFENVELEDIDLYEAIYVVDIAGLDFDVDIESLEDLIQLNKFLTEYEECLSSYDALLKEVYTMDGDLYELGEMYHIEEFDDLLSNRTPKEIANLIAFGEYNSSDEYFMFDGYGNIVTLNHLERQRLIEDYAADFWQQLWNNY